MGVTRIKVAYILTPVTFGGAEKVSLNFLSEVDRERFDIKLIMMTRPWEKESYFIKEIQRLRYDYVTVPVALDAEKRDLFRQLRVFHRIYSILKKENFDVAHTHGYFADICGLPIAKLLGIHAVSTCHGYISNTLKLSLYNRMDINFLRLSQKIIAVSEEIKSELVQRGVAHSKIEVIPNAVAPCLDESLRIKLRREKRSFLGAASHDRIIGYVGRLSEEKGIAYLIEAIEGLGRLSFPVKTVIIGDGPDRACLEQKTKYSGLDFTFTGFQKDIESWLPALDVFVLPSLTEGTPMALLEAMAMGIPVVATSVGGVPRVVTDGLNGLIVSPRDVKNMTKNIGSLLENPELGNQLGMAGALTIKEKYNISMWCRSIESHYLRLSC